MPFPEAEKRRMELERLVDAVENREIEAIEDLTPDEVALLLAHARPEESLEDLFDRLQRAERER